MAHEGEDRDAMKMKLDQHDNDRQEFRKFQILDAVQPDIGRIWEGCNVTAVDKIVLIIPADKNHLH